MGGVIFTAKFTAKWVVRKKKSSVKMSNIWFYFINNSKNLTLQRVVSYLKVRVVSSMAEIVFIIFFILFLFAFVGDVIAIHLKVTN